MSEIKNTKLFKELKKLNKEFANDVLKNSNSIIELINKKTTINFPNYTNHDIRHSIKIMETMYELVKDKNKQLSSLEYALMIYSAMFHDIGMAISDEEISNIKNENSKYLYNQSFELIKESFNNNEELSIQEVVRNAHGKIANDLINTKYKELFKLPQSSTYFSEDLGMICQAHTEDKNYLDNISIHKTKGYDEYNPRFIAILLRVADILDIDDSRTPIELYNTIDLSEFSDSEWQKNFVIENKRKIFSRNKLKEIRLEGTCEDIKVHRKLLNYIKWIENELSIAVNETANMKEQYHIQINTQVQNKIESKGYSIPDLKLNMDYHAVTNLLMGEAIYGSKDLGLRELLQNSIDAIMVKKDKFEVENDPLKDSYEPTINIDIDEKNNKVIIKDNGMGMNEYIIKNYFLNVGKSYYKSKDFLNYKHNYNPIGNFGIGFLSCFMLSDEVQVITKHFNSNKKYIIDLEKDSEYIAFTEIEDNISDSGTKIILNLNSFIKIFTNFDLTKNEQISKFIHNNILIDNFFITVNSNILLEKTYQPTLFEKKISLKEYTKKLTGFISITEFTRKNELDEIINNSINSYYINNDTCEEIISFKNLKLNEIINEKELFYCLIPLLDSNTNKKITSILEFSHNYNLEHELSKFDYICLFINKKYSFCTYNTDTSNTYMIDASKEIYSEYIHSYDTHNFYDISELYKHIPLLKNYPTPLFIVKKINIIFDNKNILPIEYYDLFSNNISTHTENKCEIFIKNIALKQRLNIITLKHISIDKILINIKNNDFLPNISRNFLTSNSANELNYIIGKIINEFILENFELTNEEKLLQKQFINFYYP